MAYPSLLSEQTIIDTALEMIEGNELEQPAVRAIAAKMGVSPASLCRYFPSVEHLQAVAAWQSAGLLLRAIPHSPQRLVRDRRYPVTRPMVEVFARHYLRFAHRA